MTRVGMSARSMTSLVVGVLLATSGAPQAARPPECTGNRYVVAGAPLLGPGGEFFSIVHRTACQIGTLCDQQRGRVRLARLRRGTRFRVVFERGACAGVDGKVKVRGFMTDDCTRVEDGVLKVSGSPPVAFTGSVSVCGDGTIDDLYLGEECEVGSPCPGDATCDDRCLCVE